MIAPKIMDFKALVEGVLNSDLLLPYTSDTPGDVEADRRRLHCRIMKFKALYESILKEAKPPSELPYVVDELGFVTWTKSTNNLKGAPRAVKRSFGCQRCELDSLEGGPEVVIGNYNCANNHLVNLEGAPSKIGGRFICRSNPLKSLTGIPEAESYELPDGFTERDARKEVARRKFEKSLDPETFKAFGDFVAEL